MADSRTHTKTLDKIGEPCLWLVCSRKTAAQTFLLESTLQIRLAALYKHSSLVAPQVLLQCTSATAHWCPTHRARITERLCSRWQGHKTGHSEALEKFFGTTSCHSHSACQGRRRNRLRRQPRVVCGGVGKTLPCDAGCRSVDRQGEVYAA